MKIEISKQTLTSKKFILSMVCLFLIIAGTITAFSIHSHITAVKAHNAKVAALHKKQAEQSKQLKLDQQYLSTLTDVKNSITDSAYQAGTMVDTYSQVWHDAIFGNGLITIDGTLQIAFNFDDAIQMQTDAFNSAGKITQITAQDSIIQSKMQKLNNPPEKFKQAYDILVNLYGKYHEYATMATSPSGTLTTYNSHAEEVKSAINTTSSQFDIRLPKIKVAEDNKKSDKNV